jgi:hypothetical protein
MDAAEGVVREALGERAAFVAVPRGIAVRNVDRGRNARVSEGFSYPQLESFLHALVRDALRQPIREIG